MKLYSLSYQELVVLRNALTDYRHRLKDALEPSPERLRIIETAKALYEQIKEDIRLYKGNV